jgi:asparagine synthase (glutamine-hydrolysing)
MGAIAARYHLDGRPVPATAIERAVAAVAARGSDGTASWREGPVGLGYAAFHATPESPLERQPLVSRCGDLCAVMDGRIDNREDLYSAAGGDGLPLPMVTDAHLLLCAYRFWGEDCARRMLGDFAFCIWDRLRRQIFCARDPLGIKPLFYYSNTTTFLAGSEIQQLFTDPAVARDPNEGMVAEYLACALTSPEETLWNGIYRLPPGHSLTVKAGSIVKSGSITKRQYFAIDPERQVRHSSDAEYAEHFLELLREAVRCRLRSHGKAGILLSGGVDSSTVTAVAAGLDRERPDQGKPETFSLAFPGLPCDETSFIDQVTQKWNLRANFTEPKESPISFYVAQARRYADFPDYPNGAMCHPLRRLARAKGFRVLLTGLGGDEWLMGSYYHYADLLKRFRVMEFGRQVRQRAQAAERFSWRTVLRYGVWPLLPQAMQRAGETRLQQNQVPGWIDADFARRTCLRDRLRARPEAPDFPTLAQRDLHDVFTSPWRLHALEMEDRASAACGIEQRHPLSDRRVVEFALGLPEEQRWRKDRTKFVLRESMRGLLPEPIRLRRTKAEFSPVFMKTFLAGGGERLFHSRELASGWVNAPAVGQTYQAMEALYRKENPTYARYTCPLWMILGIHLWRNAAFEEGPAACRSSQESLQLVGPAAV